MIDFINVMQIWPLQEPYISQKSGEKKENERRRVS